MASNPLRRSALFWATAACLLAPAPIAGAASLHFDLEGHPRGHVIALPAEGNESGSSAGQMNVPFNVTLKAKDFVCLSQSCHVTAEFNLDVAGFPPWAGASFNPGWVSFEIPQGQPANSEMVYFGMEAIILEVKWNLETRPNNDDMFMYTTQLTADPPPETSGTTVPPIAPEDYHFTDFPIGFKMANRPAWGGDERCDLDPNIPECAPPTTECLCADSEARLDGPRYTADEGVELPGFEAIFLVLGAFAVARIRRRRQLLL